MNLLIPHNQPVNRCLSVIKIYSQKLHRFRATCLLTQPESSPYLKNVSSQVYILLSLWLIFINNLEAYTASFFFLTINLSTCLSEIKISSQK